MRKLITSWKLYFILGLLSLCGFFVLGNVKVQTRQPSDAWSREVRISEVLDSSIKGSTRTRVYPIALEEHEKFIVFWNENEVVKYVEVGKGGVQKPVKAQDLGLDEPQAVMAYKEGKNVALYVLERGKLSKTAFDPGNSSFGKRVSISNGVNSFMVYDNSLYIATDSSLFCLESDGNRFEIDSNGAKTIQVVGGINEKGKKNYRIAYTQIDSAATIHIRYAAHDSGGKKLVKFPIGSFFTSVNESQSIESLAVGFSGGRTHLIVPCRNLRSNNTRTIDYSFLENNGTITDMKETMLDELNSYDPNPVVISGEGEEMKLLAAVMVLKGNKTQTFNIREFGFKDNKLVPFNLYTNMNHSSKNQHYFKIGDAEYLQWENTGAGRTRIVFASTDSNVIKNASNMKGDELKDIILDSFMALGFALSYMILIFSCIMLPTLVFVIIAAVFFLNWVEAHPRRATGISILVHVAAELILTHKSILEKPKVLSLMPDFMQNAPFMYSTVLAVAALCFLCTKLKYRNNDLDKSFINQYAFFAIMNMILYALIFFPYYYI